MDSKDIILGRGVGDIIFGLTQDKVKELLGQPDELEEIDYQDGTAAITWFYHGLGLEMSFESDDDYRLSFLSVDSDQYLLREKIRIGMDIKEVLDAAKELDFSEHESEEVETDDLKEQHLLAFEDENVNFWFDDGKLDEIQIGPYWEDDETPVWPA